MSHKVQANGIECDRVAIIGSRDFPKAAIVAAYVRSLAPGTVVISGGARGVDSWAEEAARACALNVQVFPADWRRFGRRAGPIRNAKIVAEADRLVAFWNGGSRGTLNSILTAHEARIPIDIYGPDGEKVQVGDAIAVAEKNGTKAAWIKGRMR